MRRLSARVRKLERLAAERKAAEDNHLRSGWPRAAGKPRAVLLAESIVRIEQRGDPNAIATATAVWNALDMAVQSCPEFRVHAAVLKAEQVMENLVASSPGQTNGGSP
jgi:hypothetical protein